MANQSKEENKYCKGCNNNLPKTAFHKNGKSLMPICKTCRQAERNTENYPRINCNKECPKCNIIKSSDEFSSDKSKPDGLQTYCKGCNNDDRINNKKSNPRKEGTKKCPGCNIVKATSEYATDKSRSSGLQSRCKECKNTKKIIIIDDTKTKYCKDCKQDLPRTSFHKNGKTVHPSCKTCRQEKRKAENNPRKEGTKKCPKCNIIHPTTEYHTDKQQPDGLQSYCKTCKDDHRLIYLSNYDSFLKKLFKDLRHNAQKRNIQVNITIQDIDNLYKKQEGLCVLTNQKMTYQATKRTEGDNHILNNYNISVDRIDSTKPYTKDNIQLVCAIINRMKTTLQTSEFLLLCGAISQRNRNLIDKLTIAEIDKTASEQYSEEQTSSIISDLLEQGLKEKSKNLKLNTTVQKWACSKEGFLKKLFLSTKHNLKKRAKTLAFDIVEEDIMDQYKKQKGRCALTGIKMTHMAYQKHGFNKFNVSIDRINSNKGYTKDNIQLICAIANWIKSDLNNKQLLLFCQNINKIKFNEINKQLVSII